MAWPCPGLRMRPAAAAPRCRPALRRARGPDLSGAVLLPSPRRANPHSRIDPHCRNATGLVRPARRPASRRNQKKGRKNVGRTQHHPKTDVVVAVVGVIPVANGTARVVPVVVPRAAAHELSRPPDRMSPPGAAKHSRACHEARRGSLPRTPSGGEVPGDSECRGARGQSQRTGGERNTTRKPMTSLRRSGRPLRRTAQRALTRRSLHEPPRTSRMTSSPASRSSRRGSSARYG